MNAIYQHYIIDLSSNNNFVQIPTVQGDGNGIRGFEVELIQNGTQYTVDNTQDVIISIAGTKPDTHHILNECTLTSEGYILVDITSQMSAVKGRGDYQIIMMSRSTNTQLKSFPFHIITTPAAFDIDYIISSDEFQLLTHNIMKTDVVINEANNAIIDVRTLESTVKKNEDSRVSAENARVVAETTRVNAEKNRVSAEAVREANETNRQNAETVRNNNENIRISNENIRKSNEIERQNNESIRISNENIRQENESIRQNEEAKRQSAEETRDEAETVRNLAETDRNNNELARKSSESIRNTNENTRIQNEIARQNAESDRTDIFNSLKTDINTELDKLETANIEAIESSNLYQVKVTNRDGQSSTSPNLLNTIQIGTVETGDSDENPTATITGEFGNQKLNLRLPSGKPFKIQKTYQSIDKMNADIDNINLYDFIMIHTGNVEDEDTGKLYMKDISGMAFITDLSGVQGIQGIKGDIGLTPKLEIGTVTTGEPSAEASVTLTGTPENPVINFVIPKGDTGTIANVSGATIRYAGEDDPNTIRDVVDKIKLTTEKTIDGVKFNGETNVTHYAICSTSAATAEKIANLNDFILAVGASVKVKFTVTNTAESPTLNINGTGAKAVYYRGTVIPAGYLAANRVYEFVYNGTQYELVGDINTDIDTKNTAGSTNSTSKLYLIGATSQAANPQTYSRNSVYIGTDDCLYSNNTRVNVEIIQSTEPTTQKIGDFWMQEY